MAQQFAVRWEPYGNHNALVADVLELDVTIPRGSICMRAQFVVYDDADFASSPYVPGDPETERKLGILHSAVYIKDLVPMLGMTPQQVAAEWAATLQAYGASVLPAGPVLAKAAFAARTAPPILLGNGA